MTPSAATSLPTSVALATYNGERFLPAQLDSIAAQHPRPDEIVIGDDQSTDGTAAVVEAFARRTGLTVRFTRNPQRLGSSANFAAILARCQGEVVLLSDQDDLWEPDRIATSLQALQANPGVGFVFSDASLVSESGQPLAGSLWGRVFFDRAQQRLFRERPWEVLLRTNVVTGATMAIRRGALVDALPVPPGWVHDGWLAFLIALRQGGLPLERPLISYRVHAAQQIGVMGWSPRAVLSLVRRQDPRFYRSEAENYRVLAERLRAGAAPAEVVSAVLAKAAFLQRRAAAREGLGQFLGGVGVSLRDRSYARYGLGWKQVAFDAAGAVDAALARITRRAS